MCNLYKLADAMTAYSTNSYESSNGICRCTAARRLWGAGGGGGQQRGGNSKIQKTAPVNRAGVSSLGDQLRGEVLWSAAQGEGLDTRDEPLGKPKVCHLQIAIGVQQQVLGLQISACAMQH